MNTTFKINNTLYTADELGVYRGNITSQNQASDVLNFSIASIEKFNLLSINDKIEVYINGITKFIGNITKLPINISASKNDFEIEAKNIWANLEQTVYQQIWKRAINNELVDTTRSNIVLGQAQNGEKVTLSEQISDILEYAQSCGIDFQIGTLNVESEMLLDEAKDLSCSQAIIRVLKWLPNSTLYFTYDEGDTYINIVENQSITSTDINLADENISNIKITPRHDLKLNGVCIKYEQQNTSGDNSWITINEDKYPTNISSNAEKILVMTVNLDGIKSSCKSYNIRCETIQGNSNNWWIDHLPTLAILDDFEIIESSRADDTYNRELVDGNIVSQMGFETQKDTVTAKIKYTDQYNCVATKYISTNLLSTNAFTGTYQYWTTTQYPDIQPTGLAQSIYNATKNLQYQGQLTIILPTQTQYMGKKINITNSGFDDFSEISTPVTATNIDICKDSITLNFGHSKHLYADNIAELFRINRNRGELKSANSRTTGWSSSTSSEDMTNKYPQTLNDSSDNRYERFVIASEDSDNQTQKSVDINTEDIEEDDVAKFREIYIIKNGRIATAKFLMTEPIVSIE